MQKIADYQGKLLNHVETQYRPGERDLAIALVEALGCAISDTGFKGDGDETFLAAHPNPDDRNIQNNVVYVSPMGREQQVVEDGLSRMRAADPEFAASLEAYRQVARSRPFGVPHFALRYPNGQAVADAIERVQAAMGARLGDRVHTRVFRPGDVDSAGNELVQAFIHQDVMVSGSFLFGQLIELQSQP